ncbi:hypothetical protein [Algoriphagus terrigena]|uniref:hypothetical protein n=1 Tax=Algoriphagus terrigena TaxID=344884 RepID=UPI00042A2504|nr:hypothetical protein [Algoriphagus terrigena]
MIKYSAQQLNKLSSNEVKKIAFELGVYFSSKTSKKILIGKIITLQNDPDPQTEMVSDNVGIKTNQASLPKKYTHILNISRFIIQINKSNLLDYFGNALIYPINYETRELARGQRTKDIQQFSPNNILISDGFTDEPTEQQVLLEVSLTEFDKQSLIGLHEKVHLLPYALPISRVNKIYFKSKESQENSIASASTFQDAFLPIHLFDIWNETIENRITIVREIHAVEIPTKQLLKTDKKDKFNRILGMLAFMKNAELYYTNETYTLNTYSEAYFQVLKEINSYFEIPEITKIDETIRQYYLAFINPKNSSSNKILEKTVNAIYHNEVFRKNIFKQILGTPSQEIQDIFTLLVSDKTLDAIQRMKTPELILIAFLYRFRDIDGSDKYAFKEQLPYLVNRKSLKTARTLSRASIALAVLGLYYGYRSLPKDEAIKLNDAYFASFSENGNFNIKYKLDNLLDRITIESVYQYCFWDNQKNAFDFLKDDKKIVKYNLYEGYSDEKTFSIVENHPIIRISKQHSELNKNLKKQTINTLDRLRLLIETLKKNGLVQGEITFETTEFDIWLHNNQCSELEKILAEFNVSTDNEFTNHQG